ncbi:CHAT domain-containing protein [Russula dissimulans]|nr:CHAT domain-containing protein [Russula dissimulans]
MKDVEEMTTLCRELLTSDTSGSHLRTTIVPFAEAFLTKIYLTVQPEVKLLEQVIDCLRDSVKAFPDLHEVSLALASALATRFNIAHSNDDYEEAAAILDKVIAAHPAAEPPAPLQVLASEMVTCLTYYRSVIFKGPEYSEEAIARCRTLLGYSSLPDSIRVDVTQLLATQAQWRFKHFGLNDGLQEARSRISEIVGRSSLPLTASEDIIALDAVRAAYPITAVEERIQNLEKLLSTAVPGSPDHRGCLRGLVDWYQTKFTHTGDISDIEEAIKYGRMSLTSTSQNDKFGPCVFLADVLLMAFERNGNTEYLEEAIALYGDVLEIQSAQVTLIRFPVLQRLLSSFSTRLRLLGQEQDLHEIMRILPLAISDGHASVHDRFELSCFWASVSRTAGHPSVSTAYESAMSLMQRSLVIAPTLKIQHTRLVMMRGMCETMPLEYASWQIQTDRIEEATETLERGRVLLWSEMRGLRTSIEQLCVADPALAGQFVTINDQIEELIMSVSPDASEAKGTDDSGSPSRQGMDPFGHLVTRQRKLLEERDALISRIQHLPGFENFLKAASYDTLRSAASCGPVIIINQCDWRSDILILLHNSPPSLIPMGSDFNDHAIILKNRLLGARKGHIESKQYQRALGSVLEGLYDLIGRPVIERLRTMGVPEQSRVWWCPTSVFCSLPLHAMGPIPSDDGVKRFFSDLYIPSYTPSLSALIESRKPGMQTSSQPSLLLVAQPDASLPGAWEEMEVVQALGTRLPVESLISEGATPATVLEALQRHQFVHFACHGTLETGKPFDASLKLHGGTRLALLDIARSRARVPAAAELAFLSACHTAELTRESIADEALHLTAAAQFCGFRSVVGTMWEVADVDGREVAEKFYRSLFSGDVTGPLKSGVRYHEGSAKALRDAVRKLRRRKGTTLERWVNFVHYGA